MAENGERGLGVARSLAGLHLALFRGEEKGAESIEAIERRGGRATAIPVLSFRPLFDQPDVGDALDAIESYDWIAFTSGNGVSMAVRGIAARGGDATVLGRKKIATIGEATARALEGYGVRATLVPTALDGAGFADSLADALRDGERVLVLRARLGRPEVARRLRERGFDVRDVGLYDTEIRSDVDPGLLEGVDALLFTSPSTVRGYLRLSGGKGGRDPRTTTPLVASIGAVTSRALREEGMTVDAEAEIPSFEALLDAVEQEVAKRLRKT